MKRHKFSAGVGAFLARALTVLLIPNLTFAQFLRVGPFDFKGSVGVEAVYTTNIDGQRQTAEVRRDGRKPDDLYYKANITIGTAAKLPSDTSASFSTGLSLERHPDRPDLDQLSIPEAGNIDLQLSRERGPDLYFFNLGYIVENTTEEEYVPGGNNRQTRDPTGRFHYILGLNMNRRAMQFTAAHSYDQERHLDKQFQVGDKDTYGNVLTLRVPFTRRLSLTSSADYEDTLLVTTDEETIKYNYHIGVSWQILSVPQLLYTFGFERESQDFDPANTSGWDPVHTLSLVDTRQLTPTLDLSASMSYQYDPNPAVDDIGFQYAVGLTHRLDSRTLQSLRLTREPVNTFASTATTDSTSLSYVISRSDFFFHNLSASLGINYGHDVPIEGLAEDTMKYSFSLAHNQPLSRSLTRTLSYNYSREESTLEDLPLETHEFIIGLRQAL